MKMPKTLRVGGRTYRVIYPHSFDDMPKPLLGLCDNSKQVIRVSGRDSSGGTLCDEATLQTFLHEVLHAIDYVYGGAQVNRLENSEEIIDALAEGIMQVFRDNKLDFRAGD
jgi:hypothetical protein